MTLSLTPIAVVFAFIMVGFLCYKMQWISNDQIRGLSFFAMHIALPCLILKSVTAINLAKVFDASIYLAYYLGTGIVFALGWLFARYLWKTTSTTSGLLAMSGCFSNLGFIGLPLVQATWGAKGVALLAIVLSIHPAILFITTIATIEFTSSDRMDERPWYRPLVGLMKNMVVMAVVSGGTISLLEIQLPSPVVTFLNTMSGAAAPCALFCVGGFLAQVNLRSTKVIFSAAPLKVIVMPCLVFVLGRYAFDLEPETALILSFISGQPTGANVSTLSQYYRTSEPEISSVISASTLLSFITLPMILFLAS